MPLGRFKVCRYVLRHPLPAEAELGEPDQLVQLPRLGPFTVRPGGIELVHVADAKPVEVDKSLALCEGAELFYEGRVFAVGRAGKTTGFDLVEECLGRFSDGDAVGGFGRFGGLNEQRCAPASRGFPSDGCCPCGFPFPLAGRLAPELLGERPGSNDGAIATLPALLALVVFGRPGILSVSSLAFAVVEAAGVEPASEIAVSQESSCFVRFLLDSPPELRTDKIRRELVR